MKFVLHTLIAAFLALAITSTGQIKNVKVCQNTRTSELSIDINSSTPKQILCGTNSGFYTSSDTGRTWQLPNLSCAKQKKHVCPTVLWLGKQNYFSYVSGKDTNMFDIPNYNGSLKESECLAVKRTPGKVIDDLKIFADEKTKRLNAVWSQRDSYQSNLKTDSSFIVFSFAAMSDNNWSVPERISAFGGDCSLGDSTVMGPDGCLGLNQEVYITWAGPKGLMFRNLCDKKSTTEKVVAPFVNGWSYVIGKNNLSNGLPTIVCDQSSGEFRGRLYICWSDEKHGKQDKNVFIIYSDDQGENWTEPILVTYNPNHKEQFMPRITIDQADGTLYILYYDQQNYVDGTATDLYLARSQNGGLKFDYYKINEQTIEPHNKLFYGKQMGLSAVNGVVRPIWMQTDSHNTTNVFTALIDPQVLLHYSGDATFIIEKTFSYSEKIKIDFTLKNSTQFSAVITKPLEAGFEKIVFKNKKLKAGKHSFVIDSKKLNLAKDNYTLILYENHKNSFSWILEE